MTRCPCLLSRSKPSQVSRILPERTRIWNRKAIKHCWLVSLPIRVFWHFRCLGTDSASNTYQKVRNLGPKCHFLEIMTFSMRPDRRILRQNVYRSEPKSHVTFRAGGVAIWPLPRRLRASPGTPTFHPTNEDLSLHPSDEDLSPGTPSPREPRFHFCGRNSVPVTESSRTSASSKQMRRRLRTLEERGRGERNKRTVFRGNCFSRIPKPDESPECAVE